ncbi:MAG: hypothetical protein U0228_03790 [Myxococcaceae bacterium]
MKRRRIGVAVAVAVAFALVLTWHAWLVHAGAWLANVRAADKLSAADRLTFDTSARWAPVIRTDMDDAWRPLARRGFNAFVFGAPPSLFSGGSSREDPAATEYQAWFGVYSVILDREDDLRLPERELVAFADGLLQHDQLRWLHTMGDPAPMAQVARREPTGTVTLLGREVTLFEGEVLTHSDLGEPVTRAGRFLGRASDWSDRVSSHHELAMEGFVAVLRDEPARRLYVVWGNGVRFGEVRTWPVLREELLGMIATVRLER